MTPARLGVRDGTQVPYLPRAIDDALEDRLATWAPLVVVTGEPAAGASRAAVRAARRMLGGERVVAPADPHDADVASLVAGAARGEASLVWLDGASLAVLDQITPSTRDTARRAGVRLVVTTRPGLVGTDHRHDGTTDLLRAATVGSLGALTAAEAGAGPHRAGRVIGYATLDGAAAAAFGDPVGWSTLVPQAVARVAATWEVLGVPAVLTPGRLATLVPAALAELGAPRAGAPEIRATVRRCARERVAGLRVLSATRRRGEVHLRPHPLLRAATTASPGLARVLGPLLDDRERHAVARAALLAGDDDTAVDLLHGLDASGVGPAAALRVATAMGRRPWAESWYRLALADPDEGPARKAAQAGLAWILDEFADRSDEPWNDRVEARRLMEQAVPDQRALLWLGRRDRDRGDTTAARTWWVRATTGPDVALAARASWCVAEVDLAAGDDEAALPYLERALADEGWDARELTLALGRVHRRLGRPDAAEAALSSLLTGVPFDDDPLLLELGKDAAARGDEVAARRWYSRSHLDEAVLRLTEIDLAAGYLEAVRRRMNRARQPISVFDHSPARSGPVLAFRAYEHREWGAWLAGEAAYRMGDLVEASRWLEKARDAPGDRADRVELRRGQIAIAHGHVLRGYRRLVALEQAGGPVAAEAGAAAAAVAEEARRQQADRRRERTGAGGPRGGGTRFA